VRVFVGFLAGSIVLHLAVAGGAYVSSLRGHASATTPPVLAGDSITAPSLEETGVDEEPADELRASAAGASEVAPTPASVSSQSADGLEKSANGDVKNGLRDPRRGDKLARRAPPPGVQAPRAVGTAEPTNGSAGAASSALFGAVGDRGAVDLAAAFTRAFPQASSADIAWSQAPLGSAGEAVVTVTLDESGHVDSVTSTGGTGPLAAGVSRTMALLRARPFTAHAKVTRIHIAARISPDQVHDGLHGDVFAIGQSFYGAEGNAFFALSIGRRIDIRITAR
jgi:hypothetical protein